MGPSWGHLAGKPKRTLYLSSKSRKHYVLRYEMASNINLIVGEREARSVKMSLHMLECLWTSWGASWGSFPLCCCLLLQNSTLNPKPLPVVLCIQRQRHNVSHDRIVRESLGRTFRPGVPSRAIFGPSWAFLGPSCGHLGAVLGHRGAFWGHLEASWGHLGAILGPSWGHLGPSWAILSVLKTKSSTV